MKYLLTRNKLIFLFVFIFVALCATICGLLQTQVTASAATSTTPIYKIPYYYKYLKNASLKDEGWRNDAITAYGGSHTSSYATPYVNNNIVYFNFYNPVNISLNLDLVGGMDGWILYPVNDVAKDEIERIQSGATMLKSDNSNRKLFSETLFRGTYRFLATKIKYTDGIFVDTTERWDYEFYFCVDPYAPVIEFNGAVVNNKFYNQPVTITYEDRTPLGDNRSGVASATYSRSNLGSFPTSAATAFSSGTTFSEEGNYTLKVADNAGNVRTSNFTIDKSAPTLSLSGLTNGNFSNGAVSATWSTGSTYVSSNHSNSNDALTVKYSYSTTGTFPTSATTSYTSGTSLTTAGNYPMTIADKAGNSTSYKFTIDKSAPTLSLSCGNNGFTNGAVSASWGTETTSITSQRSNSNDTLTVKYSYSTTGSFPTSAATAYTSGTSLTTAGNYLMTISDKAGNSTSYKFTIDKSAPTLTLSGADRGFTNGAVSATWGTGTTSITSQRSNSNDALTVKYSYSTTGTFPTSATTSYTSGTSLTTAGNYLMTISDKAGNKTSYKFTIDKSAPTLTLSGVTDGGFTNGTVSATWGTETTSITSQRSNSNDTLTVKYSYNTTSSFPTNVATNYPLNTPLTEPGNYLIKISDKAGNSTSYTFTIDKSAPTLTLSTSDNTVFINNRTKADVLATWRTTTTGVTSQLTNSNDTLTVKYSHSTTGSFPTCAATIFNSNTVLNTEGKYLLMISDAAGNSSKYYFEIYRQPPTYSIISEMGAELKSEHNAFNVNIKLIFAENFAAKLNSTSYTSGTLISEEGEYTLVLTDELGNRITETIYIIKTPPTANFDVLRTSLNRWYETTSNDGKTLAFASYDNAYAVADARERATLSTGTWTLPTWDGGINIAPADLSIAAQGMSYYIYKSIESTATLNAYFSLATLNEAIEKYVTSSVQTKYTPSIPATAAEGEEIYRKIYYSKSAINFSAIPNCSLYVDGIQHSYPYTITAAGLHNIYEIDIAGNSVSYIVNLDTAQPIVRVTNLNGNIPQALNYGVPAYFTYGIRIFLDDTDEQAILKINDDYYIGGVVELRAAGTYSITARDAAGNSGSLIIYISLIEPTIEIKEVEVAEVINSFTVTINRNYTLNTISSLSIMRFNEADGNWEALEYDNSSFPVLIDNKTLSYSFNITGKYRIIIVDAFGRFLEEQYNFIVGSPKGTLATTTNTELPNGAYTKSSVYFTWATSLNCSAEISRNESQPIAYERGTFITTEGVYSIKLYSNVNAIYNIYTFTIDKTAPVGTLIANGNELKPGTTTRFSVSLNWLESGCTAIFNGQPYLSGTEIAEEGSYTIILTDKAGNSATYTFKIKTSAPVISIMSGTTKLNNYGITKSDVYLTWTESNCTCLLNGAPYTANSKIRVEGNYNIILTDAYGNTATRYFTIDKTAPVGMLYVEDVAIDADNVSTNKTVSLIWDEINCTAVINKNFAYVSGTAIKEDGSYTIVLTDAAGNSSSYSFIIKTSTPNAVLYANNEEIASGSATRFAARLTWTEAGCTATVNGQPYSKNTNISTEGIYKFVVTDSYGNSGTWEITIDKTAPIISIISDGLYLEDGAITRYNTYVIWDDPKATALLNGSPVNNGACIEAEGEFTLTVTDHVGNRSSQVFIIDKTAKAGTVISNTNILSEGDITRYNAYFTWTEAGCTATLNGEPYSKGTIIKEDGTYTAILTDKAGNSTSYTFTIDKTAPTGTLYIFEDETLTEISDRSATSGSLVFTWTEENCTATVNGQPYTANTEISAEGDYTFILTDAAGNTSTYTGSIDKTAPEIFALTSNGDSLINGAETRYNIYFTWTERYCTATVNGQPYTQETPIKETGEYTIVLTDNVGNTSTLTISVYKLTPTADIIPIGEGYSLPYLNNGFSVEWDEDGCTATLNGEPYSKGTEITAEGEYQFVIINRVGTSATYDIIIDRTAPTARIFAADSSAEEITEDYSIKSVYFTWEENSCTATLNGNPYTKGAYITTAGGYLFVITDKAGNSSFYQILISKDKPVIIFLEAESENEVKNNGSTTKSVQIVKTDDEDIITLNGEVFDATNVISTVGKYTFTVTNKYGNTAEFSITIKDAAAEAERDNNAGLGGLLKGSNVGTILFFSVVLLLVAGLIIRNKVKGGTFKNKLK